MTAPPNKPFPKDGMVIVSMMKDLGITNYEPRVVNQLMDFAIRYVTCVLEDAKAFASHSKKKAIDNDDVKLAVMMQLDKIFTTPPPRDLLLEVARTKNSTPFPLLLFKNHCGIRLPPDRYCFSNCNYKLKTPSLTKKPEIKKVGMMNTPGTIKIDKRPVIRTPMATTPRAQITGTAQLRGASVISNPRSYLSSQDEIKVEPQDALPSVSGNNGENKRKRDDDLM